MPPASSEFVLAQKRRPPGFPSGLFADPTFNPLGRYLAFLGRISPEKRPDRAIRIARAAGIPLKIAAKVDKADESYFREVITPLLAGGGVEYLGEINDYEKGEFLAERSRFCFRPTGLNPLAWS